MHEWSKEPNNVTENMICDHITERYNDELRSWCWQEFHEYDTNTYVLPGCIEAGSLVYTLDLIQGHQTYNLLQEKRVFGLTCKRLFHTADREN